MLYLLFAVVCVLLARYAVESLHSALLGPSKATEQVEGNTENQAELVGEPWEALSIFEHIEQGLHRNPNAPAVICMFQRADHLDDFLIPRTEVTLVNQRPLSQNRLWQSRRQQQQEYEGSGIDDQLQGTTPCLTLTYAQLHQASLILAAGLLAMGAQPNTTMVMLIPNSIEYTILLWTCTLLRITYVSLDPSCLDITGFTALKHTLRDLKPQLVVAPDTNSGKAIDVAVVELGLPQPIRLSISGQRHCGPGWKSFASMADNAARYTSFDPVAVVEAARCDNPKRIHSIMYTSGTSGNPKGCPMRVSGMSHVLQSQSWLITPKSGAFALQQAHNSRGIAPAQILQTWKAGGAVVMVGQNFNVREATEAIRAHRVTFLVLTPPMVHEMAAELLERPLQDLGYSVRTIQVGGDAVTRDILIKCAALFPHAQVCVNHGMTEGGGSFTWPFFKTPAESIPYMGEICPVGKVAPGSRIRVWNTEVGRVVERGELGELHVSSPSLIGGYSASRSSSSFYKDKSGHHWFNTGDAAIVSIDGLVLILGRSSDRIIRAKISIMPAVIESSIEAFSGHQTIVVSIPHHVLGAEPFAVIGSYGGKTEAEIREHVSTSLGVNYKLAGLASLKQLGLVEFPLNRTHKIVRSEVKGAVVRYIARREGALGQLARVG